MYALKFYYDKKRQVVPYNYNFVAETAVLGSKLAFLATPDFFSQKISQDPNILGPLRLWLYKLP